MDRKDINEWLNHNDDEIKTHVELGNEIFDRVKKYNKTNRIIKLIELSMKPFQSIEDILEISMIQMIREQNGELADLYTSEEE